MGSVLEVPPPPLPPAFDPPVVDPITLPPEGVGVRTKDLPLKELLLHDQTITETVEKRATFSVIRVMVDKGRIEISFFIFDLAPFVGVLIGGARRGLEVFRLKIKTAN